MKTKRFRPVPRALAVLLLAVLLMSLCFAGTSADTITVATADELAAALSDAASSADSTIIYFAAGTSAIELTGSLSIPSNVTLDLSTSGGTLRVGSGCVLAVGGVISGGAVEVSGGTLLREYGSRINATITASNGGVVRGARVLSLENLSAASGESITAITYAGQSSADTSAYVARAATSVLYVRMTGSNYSSYQTIETVSTDAGNLFRRQLTAGHRITADHADRHFAVGNGLHLKLMHAAEFRNLLEGEAGILDQPDGSGLRHQGLCHASSSNASPAMGPAAKRSMNAKAARRAREGPRAANRTDKSTTHHL